MKKVRKILALDLGSTAFKMALLEVRESRTTVLQVRSLELPASTDPHVRVQILQSLITGIEPAGLSQIVSLFDDPFACMRYVTTPPMPLSELANAVRWQLQPFLAIPPEEATVEVEPSAPLPGDDPQKRRFLAVAVPAASIREHLELLSQAGLRPTQLIPKEMAIAAWLAQKGLLSDNGTAVLELGGSGSEFMVFEKGRPVFTRKIPGGGSALTREMTGGLMTAQGQVSLSAVEAESFKRNTGIPSQQEKLFPLMRGPLDRLAMDVERSLAFYGESGGQAKLGELLLIGGGAHLKGLGQWLQERLGIRVTLPAVAEEVSSTAPLGLIPVLGAAFNQGKGMNLLPAELRSSVGREVQQVALKGLVTALVLGAVLLRAGLAVSHQSLQKQISAFQLEQQAVATQLAQIKPSLAAQARLAEQLDGSEALRVLSHLVPPEIHLTDLNLEGRSVSLRGRIRSHSRRPDEVLATFMQVLGQQWMSRVALRSSRLTDSSGQMEFEVAGELR